MSRELIRAVGRLEGKMDSIIADISGLRKVAEGKVSELGTRVAKIEKKQYTVIVLASLVFTTSLAFVKKLFIT